MSELTAVVVDDSISALTQMLNLLRSIGTCSPVGFTDPKEGLDYCRANEVGLVVVDYEMPGMDGVHFIESFREDRGKASVPVVMVTSTEDKEVRYLALQVGATDFLSKPVDPVEFIARMNNQIAASQAYKALEGLSQWLTDYDAVTRLPNRKQALNRLAQAVAHAGQDHDEVAVLLISIDRFKQVIETFGHAGGDELLRQMAQRLEAELRPNSTLARIGDDDFALILPAVRDAYDLQGVIEAIRRDLAKPFPIHDNEVFTTVTIGVSLYPTDGLTAPDLLRSAYTALNTAKQQEAGGWRFFTSELDAEVRNRMKTESKLRHALANGELSLNYHPLVNIETGEMLAAEALLRWRNPDLGPVSPDLFIPIAEETGLIVPIGAWVVEQVCRDIAEWKARGLPPLRIAVNVSSRQLADASLIDIIGKALAVNGLGPEQLEIEVTERLLLDRSPKTLALLNDLRAMGLRFSIDDFGTGYSSMNYLTSFPFDVLKVDRSFVSKVTESKQDAALTQAIIAMAKSLGLEVVAEGVETQEQLDFLRRTGCTFAQGYLFSKPIPAAAFAARLAGESE